MKNKIIGLYQLVTGVYGAILVFYRLIGEFSDKNIEVHYSNFLGVLLFAGVAYAGYAMINKMRQAVKWSMIAQAVQIIGFSTGSVVYYFSGSAFISLAIPSKNVIHSQMETIAFQFGSISADPKVNIYFIPIIIVLILIARPK